MFFRKLSEQEKLERIAKRKKEWRYVVKVMFWQTLIGGVLLGAYTLFWEIKIVSSVNYAWMVSKEVAPHARFEYTISSATYEMPKKDKFSLSKDSKLSHWLLDKSYERAKAKLPEDDPLLTILKFRRDTFEYKITEQNVAAYYQMCIDAIKAIQNSSSPYKDYFIARSIMLKGALINSDFKLDMLKKVNCNMYNELTNFICQDRELAPLMDIGTDYSLLAKYMIKAEADMLPNYICVILNDHKFRGKQPEESCDSELMDKMVAKHNQLARWYKRSVGNFDGKYKHDDVRSDIKIRLKQSAYIPKKTRELLIKKCPSRAKELITVR